MFLRLLFILTFIPFVEIYFLIKMSDSIGFGNTLLIVLATGVVGAWLLRQQGHSILMEMQQQSSQGQLPTDTIAKGFFTFIGGILLLTPGILTDAIGFSLIFPLTQILWKKFFTGQWQKGVQSGSVQFYSSQSFGGKPPRENPFTEQSPFERPRQEQRRFDPEVIDVEAQSSETVEKKDP